MFICNQQGVRVFALSSSAPPRCISHACPKYSTPSFRWLLLLSTCATVLPPSFLLWDCHVGWPGSCGDSTVWGSRPFNQGPLGLLEGDPAITRGGFLLPHYFLMGDGGYTVSTSVMTPFSKKKCADSLERAYFNYQQSKARRCVTRSNVQDLANTLSPCRNVNLPPLCQCATAVWSRRLVS